MDIKGNYVRCNVRVERMIKNINRINHFAIKRRGEHLRKKRIKNIFNFRHQSLSVVEVFWDAERKTSSHQNNKDSSQGVEFIILDSRFILPLTFE